MEAFEQDGRRGLRWPSISPPTRFHGFIVRLHTVEDLDETHRLTFAEHPSFHETDEEDFGQTIGETESAEEAIDLATRELRADPARWVNQGVLQDEYNDYSSRDDPSAAGSPREATFAVTVALKNAPGLMAPGRLGCSEAVGRGGVEPPTFRFSGPRMSVRS